MLGEKILDRDTKVLNEADGVLAGRCVIMDTANEGKVKYPTSSNLRIFAGVVQYAVATNRQVTLATLGDVLCIAASAITIGDEVYMYGTAGKVASVPIGTTPEADYYSIGVAQTTATLDGDQVLVRLHGGTKLIETA